MAAEVLARLDTLKALGGLRCGNVSGMQVERFGEGYRLQFNVDDPFVLLNLDILVRLNSRN